MPAPLYPRPLAPGDRVALVSPASPLGDRAALQRGLERLRRWGFEPELMPHALDRLGQPTGGELAGPDATRADDLQRAFSDARYRGVLCVRGGYGVTRLLERLDFTPLRDDPKPIVGYSDITALLAAAHKETGLVCLHGPGVATPTSHDPGETLWAQQLHLLTDATTPAPLPTTLPPHVLRAGVAEGPLVGGNLTLVCALVGTRWQIDTRDAILFLEDVNEAPYRVDRMLTQLRQCGILTSAKGIVFGDFHLKDMPLASEAPEMVSVLVERTQDLQVPVAHGFPIGHRPGAWTLPVGARARLDAQDLGAPARLSLLEAACRAR
ncbi:MAG: LD-carboxypeptidase [Planctomycetota bacterium]